MGAEEVELHKTQHAKREAERVTELNEQQIRERNTRTTRVTKLRKNQCLVEDKKIIRR